MTLRNDVIETRLGYRSRTGSDATAGLAVVALLLALVLGFSAVDIQAERALEASAGDQQQGVLDGRGKWGGYLK